MNNFLIKKGKLNNKSAKVDIALKQIKLTRISFCGTFLPIRKRRLASKIPTPPGAVGTAKPKDHDKEKITNKNIILRVLLT